MHHVTYHLVCASAIRATLELTVVKVIVSFYIIVTNYYSNVLECLPGMYGFNCNQVCTCEAGTCHHVNGLCTCLPDYLGGNCSHGICITLS